MDEVLLVIDDPEVEALAEEIAALRELPIEEAIREALELRVTQLEAERIAVTAG